MMAVSDPGLRDAGEMAERLKAPVSKTGRCASASWVRIPLSPLISVAAFDVLNDEIADERRIAGAGLAHDEQLLATRGGREPKRLLVAQDVAHPDI